MGNPTRRDARASSGCSRRFVKEAGQIRTQNNAVHLMSRRRFGLMAFAAVGFCLCGAGGLMLLAPHSEASPEGDVDVLKPEALDRGGADVAEPPVEKETVPRDDWRLALVNAKHGIDPAYQVPLAVSRDGRLIDERCLPALEQMLDACRSAGLSPFICSAYRTQETQASLFEDKVQSLRWEGYAEQEAREKAAMVVAPPGTSEHQLGLAVDIVDEYAPELTDAQENTATQRWLMQHSWEYGFILRYPTEKSSITGIVYEPWHYRYVGEQAAQQIYEQGVCLEEYLDIM